MGDFGKTLKSLLPYWEGLRVQSVKFSPYCRYISILPRSDRALESNYLGTFSSDYFLKIKPLGDWWEGQLSESSQRFKELATSHDKRTKAQDRRLTEARDQKIGDLPVIEIVPFSDPNTSLGDLVVPKTFSDSTRNGLLEMGRSQGSETTGCWPSLFSKDQRQDVAFTVQCADNDGYDLKHNLPDGQTRRSPRNFSVTNHLVGE
jgi:hypothetical protein